jgi:hypothetical protein
MASSPEMLRNWLTKVLSGFSELQLTVDELSYLLKTITFTESVRALGFADDILCS